MEQLQLQPRLFDQNAENLAEMIEILGIENDITGKTEMQRIKIIRKEIDEMRRPLARLERQRNCTSSRTTE